MLVQAVLGQAVLGQAVLDRQCWDRQSWDRQSWDRQSWDRQSWDSTRKSWDSTRKSWDSTRKSWDSIRKTWDSTRSSLKSETDDGLSSCSRFPERPTLEEMEKDKPVLPEIKHSRGKVTHQHLEAIKDVLERNEEVFSRHKADIGYCNFVEIELEESAVPLREGARRMTPHKSDACRKEIETLLEYDMIEPSKSSSACGVVMAKKKGDQLRFCCDFRYLNSVTVKDAYPIPRIDESLSNYSDAKFLI